MPIEIQKLIGEVAARNHCRIEASDPIFAVSTINRLMLDEVVEGLILRVGAAISAFEASAHAVDAHAGKLLAEEIRSSTSAWKAEIARDINIANVRSCEMIDKLNMAHSKPAMILWGGLGLFAGSLLLVGGILLGWYVRQISHKEVAFPMTRLMFLFTWLLGPKVFSRFILFFVLGMLLLFYCLIGGLPHVPSAPAHAIKSPYPAMPKPNPVPPNTAEVMRKRMNSGPQMRLNVPAPETAAKPVPYE